MMEISEFNCTAASGQGRSRAALTLHTRRSGFALEPLKPREHTTIDFTQDDPEATLDQLEEDEDEMRRANSEVLQMQRRMLDGPPPPLPPAKLHPR